MLAGFADEVVLQNGDRITGTVQKMEAGALLVNTDAMGGVRIKIDTVASIQCDTPMRVPAGGQQQEVVRVDRAGENLSLVSADGAFHLIERSAFALITATSAIPAGAAPAAIPESTLLRDWNIALEAGLSGARGNADTLTTNLAFRSSRVTERERITINFTSLLARNRAEGRTLTSANAMRGGFRYDVNLSSRMFTFGFTNLESDKIQKLDLRTVLGGGAGVRVLESERAQFDIFTGGSFNRELLGIGEDRRSGELLFGHDLSYKLSERTALGSRVSIYPNLSNTGEYRTTIDTTTTSKFNSWLGWHVTLSNIYVSNPPAGSRNNDLLVSTGLRVSFGRERLFNPRAKVPAIAK